MPEIKCSYKELVPIHKLIEHPKNTHRHSPEQIDRLAKIIDYQGIRHPIIVSKRSGFIVAGHARLLALKKLNVEKIPVDYQEFENEASEYSFIVSDNAIGKDEWAALDFSQINKDLAELGDEIDLEFLGLKSFSLEEKVLENTSEELDLNEFDNFSHQCPKCGFEWNDSNTDENGTVES